MSNGPQPQQPPEPRLFLPAVIDLHDPCKFPEGTEFGRFIAPLYEKIQQLPRQTDRPCAYDYPWLCELADLLVDFYRDGVQVSSVPLTPPDQLFLMGHEVGDLIRRVHLHAWLAEQFEIAAANIAALNDGAEGPASREVRFIASFLRRSGFSQFIGGRQDSPEFIGTDKSKYISKEERKQFCSNRPPVLASHLKSVADVLREVCAGCRREIDPYYQQAVNLKPNMTDPAHMWSALAFNLQTLFTHPSLSHELVPIAQGNRFLVIEDNIPYHNQFDSIVSATDLCWLLDQDGNVLRDSQSKGIFLSAEPALELLQHWLGSDHPFPTVIISDIELGRDRMDGLTFFEKVHELYCKYHKRSELILAGITSSHLSRYQARIDDLITRGVIDTAWHKNDFSAEALILKIQDTKNRTS